LVEIINYKKYKKQHINGKLIKFHLTFLGKGNTIISHNYETVTKSEILHVSLFFESHKLKNIFFESKIAAVPCINGLGF
jgi:hypothetical protein